MNKIILLIIFLAYESDGYSQITDRNVRDSIWYVLLKDSTVIYSKKLWERYSLKDGEYLLLDHKQKIPLHEVVRYKNSTGDYIREKGPVETYRIEKGGPRLFVYSRSLTYSDTTGFHTDRDWFIKKGATGEMVAMNNRNLSVAMADNAASMRQLRASKTTLIIAGVAGVVGFTSFIIGAAQTYRRHERKNQQSLQPPVIRFGQIIPPPVEPAPSGKSLTSPLLIAGPVITVGAIITMCTAPVHIHKAINIYNQ